MRIIAYPLTFRPHWNIASAVLLAGAVLFATSTAHASDWYYGGDRHYGERHHGGHGYHPSHYAPRWGHYGHRYDSNRFNRFSLSINSGPGYYARPYHHSYAPAYYAPTIVYGPPVYSQPIYSPPGYTQPITYTTPPTPTGDGRYCREYTKQVWVGGRMQQSYGSACMQPDGAWEVES